MLVWALLKHLAPSVSLSLSLSLTLSSLSLSLCSLRTLLSLQYEAPKIAVAVVHLASKFLNNEIQSEPSAGPWWKRNGVAQAELEDISNQILDLYQILDGKTASGTQVRHAAHVDLNRAWHRAPPGCVGPPCPVWGECRLPASTLPAVSLRGGCTHAHTPRTTTLRCSRRSPTTTWSQRLPAHRETARLPLLVIPPASCAFAPTPNSPLPRGAERRGARVWQVSTTSGDRAKSAQPASSAAATSTVQPSPTISTSNPYETAAPSTTSQPPPAAAALPADAAADTAVKLEAGAEAAPAQGGHTTDRHGRAWHVGGLRCGARPRGSGAIPARRGVCGRTCRLGNPHARLACASRPRPHTVVRIGVQGKQKRFKIPSP